jgi:hypothetical protein
MSRDERDRLEESLRRELLEDHEAHLKGPK